MGVELYRDAENRREGALLRWLSVLALAYIYGWQPMGTELDGLDSCGTSEWCGTYFSNDGQLVTAADAAGMARALNLALVSPTAMLTTVPGWRGLSALREEFDGVTLGHRVEALLAGGPARDELKNWVRFFERGSFRIL